MSPRSQVVLHDPGGITVHRTAIPSGPQVYTEHIPAVRSVTLGVWVPIGSRAETPATAGATHFLEHLLFKGTARRSPLDIAAALESRGGEVNAFTSKEYTCYHARVLDEDLPLAIDVLADMMGHSLLRTSDIDAERAVVLEEIAMSEDDPLDVARTRAEDALYVGHPLGRPVAGTAAGVAVMEASALRRHYRRFYRPDNYTVTVVGNASHPQVVRLVEQAFGLADQPVRRPRATGAPRPRGGARIGVDRPLEQANLVLMLPGLARADERRHALSVLNAILGGGMSGRLFQEVRERRSLAYSVSTLRSAYSDTGVFGFYAGCAPERLPETREVIDGIAHEAGSVGFSADEVRAAKDQVKGQIVLELEDPGSRLMRLGTKAIFGEPVTSLSNLLDQVEATSVADVCELARDLLHREPVQVVVGPGASEV